MMRTSPHPTLMSDFEDQFSSFSGSASDDLEFGDLSGASSSRLGQTSIDGSSLSMMGREEYHPSVMDGMREIGDEAIWELSSVKEGNGVVNLRDEDVQTFWQTNGHGNTPHTLTLYFPQRVRISHLVLNREQSCPENLSYMPKHLQVSVGSSVSDMRIVFDEDFDDDSGETLSGWLEISLSEDSQDWIYANVLQLSIVKNVDGGIDSRLNLFRVFGPHQSVLQGRKIGEISGNVSQFDTVEFGMFSGIR